MMFWKTKEQKSREKEQEARQEAIAIASAKARRAALIGKVVVVHETVKVERKSYCEITWQIPINTHSHVGELIMWSDDSIVIRAQSDGRMTAFKNNPTMLGGVGDPEVVAL
jgi:hypothetical protein